MSRLTNRILLAALLGLFLTAPGIVRSQGFNARTLQRAQQRGETGNLYGTNPYEQTGEEGEEGQDGQPQDTTKKERRIRKPLESYFFSDSIRALNNFRWSVKRDYNRVEISPLDTTLTDWRIDYPFFREEVGDIAQGALGQTSLPMNYFRRPQFFDFSFASPYYAYTYDMENVPFYNTKKPIIRMTYLESGQKRFREENFNIMHAQNISPTTGFNVDYKARGTRGQYVWSRTKNHNLSVAFSHTGKRYSVHAAYYNNHIEQQENGGVVGDVGHRRYDVPDAFGRADEAGGCRGAEHLPQQRLLHHAVLRPAAATRDGERLFARRPVGGLYRPFVPVQFVEQGLLGQIRAAISTNGTHRDETGQFRAAIRWTTTRTGIINPDADARLDLRACAFRTASSCRRSLGTVTAW